jgi:hypothetical protein
MYPGCLFILNTAVFWGMMPCILVMIVSDLEEHCLLSVEVSQVGTVEYGGGGGGMGFLPHLVTTC